MSAKDEGAAPWRPTVSTAEAMKASRVPGESPSEAEAAAKSKTGRDKGPITGEEVASPTLPPSDPLDGDPAVPEAERPKETVAWLKEIHDRCEAEGIEQTWSNVGPDLDISVTLRRGPVAVVATSSRNRPGTPLDQIVPTLSTLMEAFA